VQYPSDILDFLILVFQIGFSPALPALPPSSSSRSFTLPMTIVHFISEVIGMLLFVLSDLPRLLSCAAIRWQLPRNHRDVRYAEGPRSFCDVYEGAGSSRESCGTVVLFVHGGAWAFGDKCMHADLCNLLRSCPVVAANYSLWPQGDIHAAVRDVANVIGDRPRPLAHLFFCRVCSCSICSVVQRKPEQHLPAFAKKCK
jgi:hypothetical protein